MVLLLRELIINGDAILLGAVRQELLTGIIDPEKFEMSRQRLCFGRPGAGRRRL